MNNQINEFTQFMINQNNQQREQFNITYPELPKNEQQITLDPKKEEQQDIQIQTITQQQIPIEQQSKPIKKFTFKKKE